MATQWLSHKCQSLIPIQPFPNSTKLGQYVWPASIRCSFTLTTNTRDTHPEPLSSFIKGTVPERKWYAEHFFLSWKRTGKTSWAKVSYMLHSSWIVPGYSNVHQTFAQKQHIKAVQRCSHPHCKTDQKLQLYPFSAVQRGNTMGIFCLDSHHNVGVHLYPISKHGYDPTKETLDKGLLWYMDLPY